MTHTTPWPYGNTVIMRNLARPDGTVTTAIAGHMIQGAEVLAVFIAKGIPFKNNWVVPPEPRAAYYDHITASAERSHQDLA